MRLLKRKQTKKEHSTIYQIIIFPLKVKTSHYFPIPFSSSLFEVYVYKQCILPAHSSIQSQLIDERAVTLTACVNNPHSSAIKGDRGSLNHGNKPTLLQW